jgi:N-acetylglucosamine kinase-like BadF-type ATPase
MSNYHRYIARIAVAIAALVVLWRAYKFIKRVISLKTVVTDKKEINTEGGIIRGVIKYIEEMYKRRLLDL